MKLLKKSVVLLLMLALTLCSLTSCSRDSAMRYGSKELDEADYAYLMAFIKGYYEYYYSYVASQYGQSIDLASLMNEKVDGDKTMADNLNETVMRTAKLLLVVETLCEKNGLTVTDPESLSDISEAMQELEDNYGGKDAMQIELAKLGLKASSIERYERYNYLMSLLREHRYGENGVARIPVSDVRKSFEETYAKAEMVAFSYLAGSRDSYRHDFASEYSESAVKELFMSEYMMLSYLRFTDETAAKAAYDACVAGTKKLADYYNDDACKKHEENVAAGKTSISETAYAGLQEVGENAWYLSGEEDGYYYVVYRSALTEEELDENEDAVKAVREQLLDADAHKFFDENYVTVRHILYEDEATAKKVFADLQSGATTFEEHEKDTADRGVQYTFTHDEMVDEFEEASYAMEIGSIELVQTEFGWHVIKRMELDAEKYVKDDVIVAMSRDLLRKKAQELYNSLKDGNKDLPQSGDDDLYSYVEPTLLKLSELYEAMGEAMKDAEVGELVYLEIKNYGVYIFRKLEKTDDDFSEVYDAVEEPLVTEALYAYLESFFDEVVLDNDVISRFDIRTAKSFYF